MEMARGGGPYNPPSECYGDRNGSELLGLILKNIQKVQISNKYCILHNYRACSQKSQCTRRF